MKPTVAFIGLGSNLSHPRRQLARATAALAHLPQSRLVAVSPNYLSAPVGVRDAQPDYVNAVVAVRTTLAPRALLRRLQLIERRQHRRREPGHPRNAPRTLDLDLLLYGSRRIGLAHLVYRIRACTNARSSCVRSSTSRRRSQFRAVDLRTGTGAP